jgi:murein DD-endopeptidase MepM/ murein hydrolase activator NlpD
MRFPLDKKVIRITSDSQSFETVDYSKETEIPIEGHVGAFAHVRKYHTHEGVDLYCPHGTPVYAMETGVVTKIGIFTGEHADPPMPWWNETQAMIITGKSGAILYGEIKVTDGIQEGDLIEEGFLIGTVLTVLKKDKGRPMSMLHMELHKPELAGLFCWESQRPESLLDPTELLIKSTNL